jgi:PhnB protein
MTIRGMYPRLVVSDAAAAIDFYAAAFGAKEVSPRHTDDAGRVVHVELLFGDFRIAVKDEGDGDPAPTALGGSPVIMALEVDSADAVADAMIEGGATVIYPVSDHDYGDRGGRLADPFGHLWMIAERR